MLPETSTAVKYRYRNPRYPSATWYIDREKKRIMRGSDGHEAVVQSLMKALTTTRGGEVIYSSRYGADLTDLIGKDEGYIRTVLPERITSALEADDRVRKVDDIRITRVDSDSVEVTVQVSTVIGKIELEGKI